MYTYDLANKSESDRRNPAVQAAGRPCNQGNVIPRGGMRILTESPTLAPSRAAALPSLRDSSR